MDIPVSASSLPTHGIPIINPIRTTTGRIQFFLIQIDVLEMPLTLLNFNNCHTFTGKMYLFSCLRSDLVTPGDSTLFWGENAAQWALWNVKPKSSKGKKLKHFIIFTQLFKKLPNSVFISILFFGKKLILWSCFIYFTDLATGTFVYTSSLNTKPSDVFVVNSAMAYQEYDPPILEYNYTIEFSPDKNYNRILIWTPVDINKSK